jgi:hypothetical protein
MHFGVLNDTENVDKLLNSREESHEIVQYNNFGLFKLNTKLGETLKWEIVHHITVMVNTTNKLRGLGPRANYTDRETAACQRS